MQLTLGFSPCPNDTFIFDAMVHGKIDTEGLTFVPHLEDVETLNRWASKGQLAITKLSYAAFAQLTGLYVLLDAGSALGQGCGPLLIARKVLTTSELRDAVIAIPGVGTTAHFLYKFAFGDGAEYEERLKEYVFSDIEGVVLSGEVGAGVIIHENRFTYHEKGLVLIQDLGAHWEKKTRLPIPLGGIVVRRDLPIEVQQKVNRVMARSVDYAFEHRESVMPYVRAHAQEMDVKVMHAHIDLYVNHFTKDLGVKGRAAVLYLLKEINGAQYDTNTSGIFVKF
jgi:1,4-dihydroxy-6-naphthoate synthase